MISKAKKKKKVAASSKSGSELSESGASSRNDPYANEEDKDGRTDSFASRGPSDESAPDKTNNPQDEFEMTPIVGDKVTSSKSERYVVDNMYDFKNIVASAASKGEEGLRVKKQNLVAFKMNVSNKLEHIFNIAKNLQIDFKNFYEAPQFLVGNEPCLSEKLSVFTEMLQQTKTSCGQINNLID